MKQQAPLSFEGDISFDKIVSVLDEYAQIPPLSAAPNSYLQAALQEAKLKIALSISVEEAQNIFEQIKKRSWDVNHFSAFGVDISKWLQSIEEAISQKEHFLRQIEINKLDKKIAQLKRSDIL